MAEERRGQYDVDGQTRKGLELDKDDDGDGDIVYTLRQAQVAQERFSSELRIVQSADTDILDQGGILSPLAHKRTGARASTSGTTRANLEPFCKHFEK